jgi:three-Cys-motif partner protein
MTRHKLPFDEIGHWSEIKLEILKKYAQAYSRILSKQRGLVHYYIDGFAGPGVHVSRASGDWVLGSPLNALMVHPPFRRHFLVDLDGGRVRQLRELIGNRDDVEFFEGDCNRILLRDVLPQVPIGSADVRFACWTRMDSSSTGR